jgi:hypothetical protein
MHKRGMKLARIRRMLGGGVPGAGVTRVTVRSTADTPPADRGHAPQPGTEAEEGSPAGGDGDTVTTTAASLGVDGVHGRRRTVAGVGSHKGVHRRVAA